MSYYSELGLYSGPSTSSHIPLFLTSGPYSNHSSILASNFCRPPPTYVKSSRGFRNYKPHLTTISERRTDSPLRRINSPNVTYTPVIIPRPIKINTADIDVSTNKYRKYDRQRNKPDSMIETKQEIKSPSPSRSIESPRSSTELKEATPTNHIKRERATVRLKTIHKDKVMNPTSYRKWRENFQQDELYPDKPDEVGSPKIIKKTPGELLKEKFLIPSDNSDVSPNIDDTQFQRIKSIKQKPGVVKTPSFHDICTAITSESIDEQLNPGQSVEVQRRQSRQFSTEDILKEIRRTSVELTDSDKNVIDTILDEVEAKKSKQKSEKSCDSKANAKKRRKYSKSHSSRLSLDSTEDELAQQPTLQRRPTQKNISRTKSVTLCLDEIQKDSNAVEQESNVKSLDTNKKPVITATVNIEEKPILKAVIDDIFIEESPSPKQRKGGKLKFNFTVEEISQNDSEIKKKPSIKVKEETCDTKPNIKSEINIEDEKLKLNTTEISKNKAKAEVDKNDFEIKTEPISDLNKTIKDEATSLCTDQKPQKIAAEESDKMKVPIKSNNEPEKNTVVTKLTPELKPQITESVKVEIPVKKKVVVSNVIKKKHSARMGLILEEISESLLEDRSSSGKKGVKICKQNEEINTIKKVIEKEDKIQEILPITKKITKLEDKVVKVPIKTEEITKVTDIKKCETQTNVDMKNAINKSKTSPKISSKTEKNKLDLKKTSSDSKVHEINNNTIQKCESSEDFWKMIGPRESTRTFNSKKIELSENGLRITDEVEGVKTNRKSIKKSVGANEECQKKQLGNQTKEIETGSKTISKVEEKIDSNGEYQKKQSGNQTKEIEIGNKTISKVEEKKGSIGECQKKQLENQRKEIEIGLKTISNIEEKNGSIGEYQKKQLGNQTKEIEIGNKTISKVEVKSGPKNKNQKKIGVVSEKSTVEKPFVGKAEQTLEVAKNIIEVEEEQTTEINGDEISETAMKKMISKRSLIQKAKIEDPDLTVFEPPPEPEKEVEIVQEEKKDTFVPLQSNRLSQWMHPFKKPEQYEECPVEIYARPKTIRKRHLPRGRFGQWEHYKPDTSSEEESDSESDEESSSEGEECNTRGVGASTSSNDSGFDSGAAKNKDKGPSSDTRDSPSSNPASNPAFAIDPNEEECCNSSTFQGFQKSGRITPPATTIPRFRKYCVEDFHFLKVLGKGSFGKVLLAELKDTEYYYAIKCLKKDVVLEDDDVECTLIERKVLALGTKHPYLCHLLCTFQTDSHLFFVMEYLNGGDLMFHIQQSGRFPEERARFYAAEIVSGLKFLHNKGIVYRDLKLDNILLDFDGHVRIADFGMCKLQVFLDRMADTFCGTPDYMAPEIIRGQHYNQSVDWWSFGVLLYEMLLAQSPFSGCDEDELFWSICNEKPVLPRFLSPESSRILSMLLEKDATKRLGTRFSPCGDIKDQPFFKSIDWDQLEARLLEPPFKPSLSHPLDTKYFDKQFTVEQARLTPIEHHILESMDQTQFQGFSYTNPNATDK